MMNNKRAGWNLLEDFPAPEKRAKNMENEQKQLGGRE
jgi:hypothetical protein